MSDDPHEHVPDTDGVLHDVVLISLCIDRPRRTFQVSMELDTLCLTPEEITQAATAIIDSGEALRSRGVQLFAERN